MAWLASTASEGEEGDPFLERPDAVSVLRRYANWLHTGKKKRKKKNMSTERYFYTDTTGYAENMFRIYRTVEYRYAPHNDVWVKDEPHIRRWSHKIVI